MKEVDFRTIDKLFIKMSINDKMWVIFAIFLVAIGSIAGGNYYSKIAVSYTHLTLPTRDEV